MTEDEFLELVQKHQVWVYRHALYLLRNSEDAKDITQETFIVEVNLPGRYAPGCALPAPSSQSQCQWKTLPKRTAKRYLHA